jgi:hypothetical protein
LDPEFVREAMRAVPVVDDEGHTHMIDPIQLDKITSAPHSAHSRASALRGASLGGSSSRRSILVGEPIVQYASAPGSIRSSSGRLSNFVSGSASGVANAIQDVGSTIGSTVGSLASLPARAVASIAEGLGGDGGRTSYYAQPRVSSSSVRPRNVIEGGLTSLGSSIASIFV